MSVAFEETNPTRKARSSAPGAPSPSHISQAVLDLMPTAVYVCDGDGVVTTCNRRAVELWGRDPKFGDRDERFCGSHRMYRLDGGPLPPAECPMADALRTGEPVRDREVVIERPDGSRIVALVNIDALRDESGAVVGAINCFQDITAIKRAQEEEREDRAALRKQERRSRELLDALPAAVYTTDAAGRITYFNRAAAELAGREPTLGSDEWCVTWRLFWPDGRPMPHDQCPMAVALKEDRPVRGEEAIAERPDGARVPFIPYPVPLHDEAGAVVGAVNMLVDISERKASEEALRQSEEKLSVELEASRQLQAISTQLIHERDTASLYEKIIDAAVSIMRSDFASMQMFHPERGDKGELQLLAFRGFDPEAAKFWEWVRADSRCTCGEAMRTGRRAIAENVETCGFMAGSPDRTAYLEAGMYAAQSTPLISRSGRLLGMISTHWRKPHSPTESELRRFDVLARQAADLIERAAAAESLNRAVAQTEQQRRLYEAILTNTPDLAYVFDLNHRFTYANEGLLKIWGKSREEAIGKNCLELGYEPWHAAMHDREIEQVVATKQPVRGEVPFTGTLGRRIYDYVFVPVIGVDGEVEAVAGTTRDVTERKQTIDELAAVKDGLTQQLADMQRLYDFSRKLLDEDDLDVVMHGVLVAVVDLLNVQKGSVQLCDPSGRGLRLISTVGFDKEFAEKFQFVEACGFTTCAAALNRRERVIVEDLLADASFAQFAQVAAPYGIRAAQSIPLLDRSGAVSAMLTTYFERPYRPSERELRLMDLYLHLAARHIERKQAERDLRRSEERFRAFITATSDVVYRMNADWTEMRHLDGKAFITHTHEPSRTWLDKYIHPDDQARVTEAITEAIRTKSTFELEHRVLRVDGALGWTFSRAIPLFDEHGEIVEWFGAASDVTERKRHEERQRLLVDELNHRVKNTLATVQSLAAQTLRDAGTTAAAREAFESRLMALSQTHDVLTRRYWEGADMHEIVRRAIAPYSRDGAARFEIEGPEIRLVPKAALALSMALHELATNAAKYGALSNGGGRVEMSWRVMPEEPPTFGFEWIERGGPPVAKPRKRGFGSRLIEEGLAHDIGGDIQLSFRREGLVCAIAAPLDEIRGGGGRTASAIPDCN